MKNLKSFGWMNLVVLLVTIGLSYATNYKLINKNDIREISDRYPSLFTPAAITFTIWGVIYTSLLAFCIYHLVSAYRQSPLHQSNIDLARIDIWFFLNNLFAIGWLFLWTNDLVGPSLILMVCQLVTLIIINLRLGIHDPQRNAGSKIFTHFPLSIYLAWISIATIANTAIYLVSIHWNGMGLGYTDITWTRIMIVVASIISFIVILGRKNVFFGLVVIWAFYGIILERRKAGAEEFSDINLIAWTGIISAGLISLVQLVRNLSKTRNTQHPTFPASSHSIK